MIPPDAPPARVSAFLRSLDFGAADNPLGLPKRRPPLADPALWTPRERSLRRHEEFWIRRLEEMIPLAPPGFEAEGDGEVRRLDLPSEVSLSALLLGLALEVGQPFDLALGDAGLRREIREQGWEGLLEPRPPLRVEIPAGETLRSLLRKMDEDLDRHRSRETYSSDLPERIRRLRGAHRPTRVVVDLLASEEELPEVSGTLAVTLAPGGGTTWRSRAEGDLESLARRVLSRVQEAAADPERPWRAAVPTSTVDRLFREQAARAPEAVALEADGESWSYRRLADRAGRLAAALRRRGVGPEKLVALRLERVADLVTGMLGVLEAGGAFLALDPQEPPGRLARLLEEARPWLALGDGDLHRLAPFLPVHPIALADAPEGPAVEPSERNGWHLAYVAFTSGSTGFPKGVAVEHHALAGYIQAAGEKFGLAPGDRLLYLGSPAFDLAYEQIFGALCHGATLVELDGPRLPDSATLLAACGERGVTVLDLPTAVWERLARDLESGPLPLPSSLRLVVIGGEAAREAGVRAWRRAAPPSVRLLNTYGPTEATIVASWWEGELEAEGDLPLGRPVPGVEARVAEDGELWLGGPGLARGYHRRPELTAERFVFEDGRRFYRTGDRCRLRPDGELELLGRIDRQVKIGGRRIEPAEVEAVLRGIPGVADAVVAPVPGEDGRPRLHAWVIPRDGEPFALDRLREDLARHLPAAARPVRIAPVESFPRTLAGKLDLAALKESPPSTLSAPQPLRSPEETALAALWEQVLGAGEVGPDDDFFDLGGDSLAALALLSGIEKAFGRRLPVARLLEAPTLAALAREVRRPEDGARPSCLIPLQPLGSGAPFVCVHGLGGHLIRLVSLARAFAPHHPFLGVQSPALDGHEPVPRTVEEIARRYLAEVQERLGPGPLHLGGMSLGGIVAFEMARQASVAGLQVGLIALFDSNLDEVLPELAPRPKRAWWRRLLRERAKPEPGPDAMQHAYRETLKRYRPGPYSGKVTYLSATPRDPAVFEALVRRTGCDLEIVPVSGDHLGMVEPPHVETLAGELIRRLL